MTRFITLAAGALLAATTAMAAPGAAMATTTPAWKVKQEQREAVEAQRQAHKWLNKKKAQEAWNAKKAQEAWNAKKAQAAWNAKKAQEAWNAKRVKELKEGYWRTIERTPQTGAEFKRIEAKWPGARGAVVTINRLESRGYKNEVKANSRFINRLLKEHRAAGIADTAENAQLPIVFDTYRRVAASRPYYKIVIVKDFDGRSPQVRLQSGGKKLAGGLPTGTYTGKHSHYVVSGGKFVAPSSSQGSNAFQMVANFATKSAKVNRTGGGLLLNLTIKQDGTFADNPAKHNQISTSSGLINNIKTRGSFHGAGADGVSGVYWKNHGGKAEPNVIGAFAGSR